MKKIMINDRYGLTQAVLDGRKTMTRRIVPKHILDKVEEYQREYFDGTLDDITVEDAILIIAVAERMFKQMPKIGEVVAVAQSYKDLEKYKKIHVHAAAEGWRNKMFVRADLMPHQIQITDICVERLQDITDDECLREGIYRTAEGLYSFQGWRGREAGVYKTDSPRVAFLHLIDKVSGNGTWEANPYVFVYSFQLIK